MNSFRKKSTVIPLLLCVLIGCLLLHIFVEDALFVRMFASLDSRMADPISENSEEYSHLDDLAHAGSQPVIAAGDDDITPAFPWDSPQRKQALLPIFKPPKM